MSFSQGMHSARGRTLLFADADGATSFQDLEQLESALLLLASSNNKQICDILCTYVTKNINKHFINYFFSYKIKVLFVHLIGIFEKTKWLSFVTCLK